MASPFDDAVAGLSALREELLAQTMTASDVLQRRISETIHDGPLQDILGVRQEVVELTWDGNDEMDPAQGRGWAVVKGDELHGMIFFHGGDDSEFVAKKVREKKTTKRK